ncbi:PepSY domain-containing protein [Phreatobacter stygius]|uniref:PepSY domain-containing protein n=1 Tax=Phreatobacter stygius TaxID=1940610 RepID=A0A4D7BAN1_9HYPH|nr:hypothetical protein [Phreatobacter stygius]QCI66546.1 hypothetical protein E8M01_21320 [Phreatobacter stygius]
MSRASRSRAALRKAAPALLFIDRSGRVTTLPASSPWSVPDMTLLKTCAVMFVLALAPASAMAQGCLTPSEQRAAIAGNQAVPLEQATRNLRPEHRGDVVNARLCRVSTGQLVYLLTVVNRHGKVMRARFDAATGQLVQVR